MVVSVIRSSLRTGLAALTASLAVVSFQVMAPAAQADPVPPSGVAPTEADKYVEFVYVYMLMRAPDAPGRAYWTAHVEKHGPVPFVQAVVGGDEWRRAWVDQFYDLWLDRSPDEAGLGYWAGYIADHRFDDFEVSIGGSDEAYARGQSIDIDYIDLVYLLTAYRLPSETEVSQGLWYLAAGPASGFLSSVLRSESGLAGKVRVAYDFTLHREPDAGGQEFWMAYYRDTGDMAQMLGSMLQSPEAWRSAQTPPASRPDLRSPPGV